MFTCFGPSTVDKLQHEIDSLRVLLQTKETEIERLRRSEISLKHKEEQQTEALQAAATHVAQLEAQRIEQQRAIKDLEAHLRTYEQQLLCSKQQADKDRDALEEQKLQAERQREQYEQRLEEQKLQAERQRKQYEETVLDQKQKLANLADESRQRQLVEARLREEQKMRLEQERRARKYQKQIANFTSTMEEVSNILTAVEGEKTLASPVKIEGKKDKTSAAADQLRQSIALLKRTQDERPSDLGEDRDCM